MIDQIQELDSSAHDLKVAVANHTKHITATKNSIKGFATVTELKQV